MRTRALLFALAVLAGYSLPAQNHQPDGWGITVFYGYQKHNKQFSEYALPDQGDWGTSQFGANIRYRIFQKNRWQLGAGFGYAREINTYRMTYDHCFDNSGGVCTDILSWIDKYNVDLLQYPVYVRYTFRKQIGFSFDLVPQVSFHKDTEAVIHIKQITPPNS